MNIIYIFFLIIFKQKDRMFQSGNTSLFCFVFYANQYIILTRHNVFVHALIYLNHINKIQKKMI